MIKQDVVTSSGPHASIFARRLIDTTLKSRGNSKMCGSQMEIEYNRMAPEDAVGTLALYILQRWRKLMDMSATGRVTTGTETQSTKSGPD